MKKQIQTLIACVALACALMSLPTVGCKTPTQQRASYNTLSSLGKAVDIAEREYVDRIIAGKIKTNSFPRVQLSYQLFQTSFGIAVRLAGNNSNAVPSAVLVSDGNNLLSVISEVTKKEAK